MPVAPPPIEAAEQFLDPEPEPGELIGALRRPVAADAVAIDDVYFAAVEARRRCGVHLAMRETDRARNMAGLVRAARSRGDHDDAGMAGFKIDRQIPGIGMEAQLVVH